MPGIRWSFSKLNQSNIFSLELDGIKRVMLQLDSKKENIDAILDITYINNTPDFPVFQCSIFPSTPPEQKQEKTEEQPGLYEFTKFAEKLSQVAGDYKEATINSEMVTQKPPVLHRKEKNGYKEVTNKGFPPRVTLEQIKERLLSFVAEQGVTPLPYSSGISSVEGREIREKLYEHLGTKATLSIKLGIEELIKEGKLIKTADTKLKNGRSFIYSLPGNKEDSKNTGSSEEVKSNNEKALEGIKNIRKQKKTLKDLKDMENYIDFKEELREEEEDEDMGVRDTAIEVLSPERSKKRLIKRKCKKCGNSLLPMNTKDDSLTSKSLTIETDESVDYWHCIICGRSYFEEEEVLTA